MLVEGSADWVVVATAASLERADVLRLALEVEGIPVLLLNKNGDNWLSHLGREAVDPSAIQLCVPPTHVATACEVLGTLAERDRRERPEADQSAPDKHAASAYRSAILLWYLPPLAALTAYRIIRAARGRRLCPPKQPERFRKHLLVAFLVGIVLPAIIAVGIVYLVIWSL